MNILYSPNAKRSELAQTPIPIPPQTQALACASFCPPALDGSLNLFNLCDWHYEHSLDHPLFVFPCQEGSTRTITWREAVSAVYLGVRLVRDRLGVEQSDTHLRPQTEAPVVGIVSQAETIAYSIAQLSLMRANFIPFLISTRNSPTIVAHLLASAGVEYVLVSGDKHCQELVERALDILCSKTSRAAVPKVYPMFLFEDFFPDSVSKGGQAQASNLGPVLRKDPHEAAVYIHSSGSTSQYPKIIPWSHRKLIEIGTVPYYGGKDLTNFVISLHSLPMFHSLATSMICMMATCGFVTACFEPRFPPTVPTSRNVLEASERTDSDVILAVPSFLEEWLRQPEKLRWLSKKDGYLAFGGSPLGKEVGDKLVSEGISIMTQYGATEVGTLASFFPKSPPGNEWEYFQFSGYLQTNLVPQGDGTFEVVVTPSTSCIPAMTNVNIDGVDSYSTSDLVVPHPTKPGFWKLHGRSDDQIVHTSGEKTNPGPLEAILRQDPHIRSALLFGKDRFQVGVLLELKDPFTYSGNESLDDLRDNIWPTIQKMNEFAPRHSRLLKEMILFADRDKPFKYTAKGTARRQAILDDYKDEIEKLYESIESKSSNHSDIPSPSHWDADSAMDFVRKVVMSALVLPKAVTDDDNFFTSGCDSLHATWIRTAIVRAIRGTRLHDPRQITQNFVYEHPTVSKLAQYLLSLVQDPCLEDGASAERSKVKEMNELVERYSSRLSTPDSSYSTRVPSPSLAATLTTNSPIPSSNTQKVVLLTGSTGGFGSFILASLLTDMRVSHVYALNRGTGEGKEGRSLEERQQEAFRDKGLDAGLLESEKLRLLEGDLVKDDFGLPLATLLTIRESVTHIVHNAWPVDFNLKLSSFESSIRGSRNLLDLSVQTGSEFMFISSVGVFQNASESLSAVEKPVPPQAAIGNGYAESKWVVEKIILNASKECPNLTARIVRLGQICGSDYTGSWHEREWVPAMIQSASELGCIPKDDRAVSWIPPYSAANAVLDFLDIHNLNYPQKSASTILHIRHPNPTPWTHLATTVAKELNVDVVPYEGWLKKLEDHQEDRKRRRDGSQLYASRLLPFYQGILRLNHLDGREGFGMPLLDIRDAVRASRSLNELAKTRLGEEDVRRWLCYWTGNGHD
ncbi:acetyl-CoA synthetase-like protein [Marasmius fiardii PR-910]|nr:acetyl-CoA synthetase-like protein [Marasmius fiardii PR-910]